MTDESQDGNKREQQKARARRDADDLRSVMSTPAGRRFVARLLSGVELASFVLGKADASAYQEGRRSVALGLLAECRRSAPNEYRVMIHEANQ